MRQLFAIALLSISASITSYNASANVQPVQPLLPLDPNIVFPGPVQPLTPDGEMTEYDKAVCESLFNQYYNALQNLDPKDADCLKVVAGLNGIARRFNTRCTGRGDDYASPIETIDAAKYCAGK